MLGLSAHLHCAALAKLLDGPRPLVALVGDERAPGGAEVGGLKVQARLLDFLLDHCDEVCLGGASARLYILRRKFVRWASSTASASPGASLK